MYEENGMKGSLSDFNNLLFVRLKLKVVYPKVENA